MLHFSVLGSGSAGNAAVVSDGTTTVLIDAGLSARQLCCRLEARGFDPDQVAAVLITHEHGDHIRGLDVFCKGRPGLSIYANPITHETLGRSLRPGKSWQIYQTGDSFHIGTLSIHTFPIPHDAVEPVGFTLTSPGGARLGFLSDVGFITHLARQRLAGIHALFVEANYDPALLDADTRRPWATKQRIASRHGHLSNDQAAELVADLAHPDLLHVVLGHLSKDCNNPARALARVGAALDPASPTKLTCALQHEPTPLLPITPPTPKLATPVTPQAAPTTQARCREQAPPRPRLTPGSNQPLLFPC
jgi:phosphoribosyl 1,2-cyclic phosphodiesterase